MEKIVNNKVKLLVSFISTIVILFFLFKILGGFNVERIQSYFTIPVIFISLIIYLLIKITNTYRYNLLFNQKEFFKSINILFFSNFMLTVIPFRLGEISYIRLFKKHYNINYSKGIQNLIFLRICDYITICTLMLISFVFMIYLENFEILKNDYILPILGVFVLGCSILIVLFVIEIKIGLNSKFINRILSYISNIKKTPNKFHLVILSFIYWFLRFFLGIYLFWAVGINLSFFSLFFISTLMILISLIPIQTIAGFGIFEGTWTTAFLIFGVNSNNILDIVLAVHLLGLINIILFGIISYVILHTLIQNKSDRTY